MCLTIIMFRYNCIIDNTYLVILIYFLYKLISMRSYTDYIQI
jgi:hypothetical protein